MGVRVVIANEGQEHVPPAQECRIQLDDIELAVHPDARAYYLHRFEPLSRQLFRGSLRAGDRVLDIGANAGYYTIMSARAVGPGGHVFAIEPSPTNLSLLHRNVDRLGNVTILPVAAGAGSGNASLILSHDSLNDAFAAGPYGRVIGRVNVAVRSLDDLVAPPIHAIKMDVQGHEPEALSGLRHLVDCSERLTLLVEWAPACLAAAGHRAEDLPAQLTSMGLTITHVIPDHERFLIELPEALHELAERPTTRMYWNILATK